MSKFNDKLEDFKNKYLGKSVEFHSYGVGAYNQCVDLINQYIHECLDNNTKDYTEIIGADAKSLKDKFDPEDFDFIANSTSPNVIPERGDILVWNGKVGGGAGHTAVVLEASGTSFKSLDQNWSQVEKVTEEAHNYTNVVGWLRPKHLAQDCKDIQDRLDKSLEDLMGVRKSREEWRNKYNDLLDSSMKNEKTLKDHIESLQKSQSEMNAQLTNVTKQYQTLTTENKSLTEARSALEGQIKTLSDEKESFRKELDTQYLKVVELNDDISELKRKNKNVLKNASFIEFIKSKF